jgi:hypothetical protein
MVYRFALIGAALGMTVEDVFTQNRRRIRKNMLLEVSWRTYREFAGE